MIKLKKIRKNPTLIIDNLKLVELYSNGYLKNSEIYEFTQILFRELSRLFKRKMPTLFNKVTTFYIEEFPEDLKNSHAIFDPDINGVVINAKKYQKDILTIQNNENKTINILKKWLRILSHETGHVIYFYYLSYEDQNYFKEFVRKNMKNYNVLDLYNLTKKYSTNIISKNYPIEYVIIESLELYNNKSPRGILYDYSSKDNHLYEIIKNFYNKYGNIEVSVFSKPASSYMPQLKQDPSLLYIEIFAEIFANYIVYDLHMLHSDTYKMLKTILSELRN